MISEKNKETAAIIIAIHYQYFKNIASLKKTGSNNLYTILFIGAEIWKQIYFTPAGAKFSQISKHTEAGIQYTQYLKFSIPGENVADQDELSLISRLPVVCRIEYSDGTIKLLGSYKIPAYFSEDYNSDEKASVDSWQATCVTNKRAFFLDS